MKDAKLDQSVIVRAAADIAISDARDWEDALEIIARKYEPKYSKAQREVYEEYRWAIYDQLVNAHGVTLDSNADYTSPPFAFRDEMEA